VVQIHSPRPFLLVWAAHISCSAQRPSAAARSGFAMTLTVLLEVRFPRPVVLVRWKS
jgi:hypothetical protein